MKEESDEENEEYSSEIAETPKDSPVATPKPSKDNSLATTPRTIVKEDDTLSSMSEKPSEASQENNDDAMKREIDSEDDAEEPPAVDDGEEDKEEDDRILEVMYAPEVTRPDPDLFELYASTEESARELLAVMKDQLTSAKTKLASLPKRKGRVSKARSEAEIQVQQLHDFVDELNRVTAAWIHVTPRDVTAGERAVKVRVGREVGLCPKPSGIKRESLLIPVSSV